MKYVILTILLLIISHQKANALEIKLTQGFAYHFTPSLAYNDSVFDDNHTSTNTLLTLSQGQYSATLLADSQGDMSIALIRSISLSKRFSLIAGLYLLRDKELRIYEPNAPILNFPTFAIEHRSFIISPLIGLQHSLKLTNKLSLDTLVTPAFILTGISFKL